jgi:hypothetical protein
MEYVQEIWNKMADKYMKQFATGVAPLVRGRNTVPTGMLLDLARASFMEGAKAALKMANEVDKDT